MAIVHQSPYPMCTSSIPVSILNGQYGYQVGSMGGCDNNRPEMRNKQEINRTNSVLILLNLLDAEDFNSLIIIIVTDAISIFRYRCYCVSINKIR